MGRYCYKCGQKIIGGCVPSTCDCIAQGFCGECWKALFQPTYVEVKKDVYEKDGDDFFKILEPVYVAGKSRQECELCGSQFFEDQID
jgi:hypothetical protein